MESTEYALGASLCAFAATVIFAFAYVVYGAMGAQAQAQTELQSPPAIVAPIDNSPRYEEPLPEACVLPTYEERESCRLLYYPEP